VAGIAAAAANNGKGVAGIGLGATILPIKVCSADERLGCPTAAIANGIAWAVSHGARVINLSLGGYGSATTICNAVKSAVGKGVVVVAAAGNDGTSKTSYPAECPGAIGVAASGPDDDSSFYSNWDYPDALITAPGGNDPG